MEENKKPAWKVALNFGLITGVLMIIFQLIIYLLDFENPQEYQWLNIIGYAILIGGMIWGSMSYRDIHNNGLSTYSESFSSAFLTALFAAILVSIFGFLLSTYDPSITEKAMRIAEENMYDKGLTDEQIQQGLKISKIFAQPIVGALSGLIVNTIVGAVLALIIAIFTKREAH